MLLLDAERRYMQLPRMLIWLCWTDREYGCPNSIEGTYYKLGNRKSAVKAQTLAQYYDAKIKSVWCKTMGGEADKEMDEKNGRTTDGRECLE
jgi:hypothetical protein